MKYKQFVYTPVIIIIASVKFIASSESGGIFEGKFSHGSKLEKVVAMWNRSYSPQEVFPSRWPNFPQKAAEEPKSPSTEEFTDSQTVSEDFPTEFGRCVEDHQYQITGNYSQGKNIILNCFKATLILNLFKYLGPAPKTNIKFFNGLLELEKIPDKSCGEGEGSPEAKRCKYNRYIERLAAKNAMSQTKKNEYIRMYKKAMEKLINERTKYNPYKNLTEEEKEKQLNKINEGSQAFLSEILKNFANENAEKVEEENLKRDLTDPRLLSVVDAFTRNYMLKLKFYPGVAARMKRSHNGGVTFDLEIVEPSEENGEEEAEEEESDEGSTREIKEYKAQAKGDYFDDDDSEETQVISKKGNKKKKKEMKKKAKKMKKIIPYLLIPMLIQVTLLPFVFKKLFFLAMKALFAGKVALILVGFNLLRNTCIRNEDSYAQKIRVEHYGYKPGEEYGAWINERSFGGQPPHGELSEEPFRGQKPVYS